MHYLGRLPVFAKLANPGNIGHIHREYAQPMLFEGQCYLKVFSKLAEDILTVTLIKCYFYTLHFNKGFTQGLNFVVIKYDSPVEK